MVDDVELLLEFPLGPVSAADAPDEVRPRLRRPALLEVDVEVLPALLAGV